MTLVAYAVLCFEFSCREDEMPMMEVVWLPRWASGAIRSLRLSS
jgi:hypothetical protein